MDRVIPFRLRAVKSSPSPARYAFSADRNPRTSGVEYERFSSAIASSEKCAGTGLAKSANFGAHPEEPVFTPDAACEMCGIPTISSNAALKAHGETMPRPINVTSLHRDPVERGLVALRALAEDCQHHLAQTRTLQEVERSQQAMLSDAAASRALSARLRAARWLPQRSLADRSSQPEPQADRTATSIVEPAPPAA